MVLAAIFQKIEPFGGRKRGKPEILKIEKLIADSFSVADAEIAETGVRVYLPDTENNLEVENSEISTNNY